MNQRTAGKLLAAVSGFVLAGYVASGPVYAAPELPAPVDAELATAVQAAYEREFGETVPRPAIYNDSRSVDCNGDGHLTTTAYLGERRLVYLYLSRDGGTVRFREEWRPTFRPAGSFRVLTVLVEYPETTRGRLALWEDARAEVNRSHAEFAGNRGYDAPIVVFENVNLVIEPSGIRDPRDESDVIAAAKRQGVSPEGFDIIVSINIDPNSSEGGFAAGAFIYVGNYLGWQGSLTARDMDDIAITAYHHEVGHVWGWAHEWAPFCEATDLGFKPFTAPPILFGWEDTDGDGVPEVLDTTPYGRSAP